MKFKSIIACVFLIATYSDKVLGNWNDWWTYDGISGPAYWGLINPAWTMCNKVRIMIDRLGLNLSFRVAASLQLIFHQIV